MEADLRELNKREPDDIAFYRPIKPMGGVTIITTKKWYIRLWYVISNPFRYIITGKIKY